MPRVLILVALVACVLATSGCGLIKNNLFSRKKTPEGADSTKDVFIGVVESVNPEQKFVLVRTDTRMIIAPGTKLESRSMSGSKASLTVTPERKLNFLSADIAEGSPATGDVVIMPGGSITPGVSKPPSIPSLSAPPDPAAPVLPSLRLPEP
jgi:hypothetical protein